MARKSTIEVSESIEELKKLSQKQKNYRIRTRIRSLILLKEKKFPRQTDISTHLGVDYATLKRWFKKYKEYGLSSLLSIESGGAKGSSISVDIHKGLESKLQDSKNPLLGYWDAILWVKQQYGETINYQTLRSYLIRHFKTKLKHPRKSHYKKNEQAIEAFKKTAPPAG
jgi:transposase